jgi:hypothetical protein
MKLESIHVYVEYRMSGAPGEIPRDRLLRARVRQWTAEGWTFGKELIAPRRVFNVRQVEEICIAKLWRRTRKIIFDYEERLGGYSRERDLAA